MDKAMHSEFEGHTPGPWIELDGFIYSEHVEDRPMIAQLFSCSVSDDDHSLQFNECNNIEPNGNLIAAAPDLLKENQSLRSELQSIKAYHEERLEAWHLELQKQKELNAELVEAGVQLLRYDSSMKYVMREKLQHHEIFIEVLEKFESLIKKSKPA